MNQLVMGTKYYLFGCAVNFEENSQNFVGYPELISSLKKMKNRHMGEAVLGVKEAVVEMGDLEEEVEG